jgi:hypothetical protein
MIHAVMLSGGLSSWCTAKRVIEKHGPADVRLIFADTLMEDEDLYRFLDESIPKLGAPLVRLCDGRTPWEVFHDVRFLGNSRIDPCSRILKRDLIRKWLDKHCSPGDTTVYLGFDWTEPHRMERAKKYWEPWTAEAPLMDPPYLDPPAMQEMCRADGMDPPRLYAMGFPHNNCGGFCVKAGHAQFKKLLKEFPCRYAYHEREEEIMRQYLGKDVAILKDRRGGMHKPLTLKALRERLQANENDLDPHDWGGCNCFDTIPEESTP